jgi:hypothetical protein
MKRVISSNDLVGTVKSKLAVSARQLHCPFIGFGAAVTEEDPV